MKKNLLNWMPIIMAFLLGLSFISCHHDDPDDQEQTETETPTLIGIWICDFESDIDFIICFKEDGTGYDYFTGNTEEEREEFSYKVRDDKITFYYWDSYEGKYYNRTVEYDLSSNGKSLTLFGMDNNDMAVLHFKRK